MKYVSANSAEQKQNSESCEVREFGNIETIDGADIVINGRYPEVGFAMNENSDMVARVLSGSGRIITKKVETSLNLGDVVFVEKQEAYYLEGDKLELFMVCAPAWKLEQYKNVE